MVKPKKPDIDKSIFSPAEACGYIGLSWNTLRTLISDGQIRAVRLKRRYLIPKAAIDEFMDRDSIIAKAMIKGLK